MILDGVAPPDISILGQFPVDTEAALQKLFDDCEAATPCHQAFPDLVAEFATLQSRLRASPGLVPFRDPATGELQSHYMDDEILRGVTRQVLYHRTLSVLLPLALHKAHEGDFQPLLTLGYQFGGGSSGISAGMMASVFCAEDISRLTGEEPEGRFYRHADNGMLMRVCEFWPTGEVPDSYFEPVESSVPTVLLSGELDPVTPPKYGEHAHQTLHQSVHIVVPGVGHNASFTGCLPDVLYGFLGDLQTGKVDSGCTEHLKRPAFFTTPAGPVPLFDTASEPVANQSEPLQEVTDGGQGQ